MFERELCKHPDINHVDYTPHTYNETHHWLKAACMLDLPRQEFYGHKVPQNYGSKNAVRKYLIDGIQGNVPDFKIPSSDEDLVILGWEALCEKYAKPVFFEKTPHYLVHWACLDLILRWMERMSYDVKFIGLIRNPMSVMYSANKLFYTSPDERQFGWAQAYRNLLSFKDFLVPDQFLLVRYEELIADPQASFRNICSFLDLDHYYALGQEAHKDSLTKWKDDANFGFQLNESVARLAKHYGYTEEELTNPGKATSIAYTESLGFKTRRLASRSKAKLIDRYLKPLLLKYTHKKH